QHSNRQKVAILGAGVGGLFSGAHLAKQGFEVTIFEQLPVYGGGLYSYERGGETWNTGMHILSGLGPDGAVTKILDELEITPDIVPTTLDNTPAALIGEAEWQQSNNGVYRFVGGSQKLADQLALYITRHGGRILLSQKVEQVTMEGNRFIVKTPLDELSFNQVISSLHPKQLLAISQIPLCRPIAAKRILATPETFGSFKVYITLKHNELPYDEVTHYLPKQQVLIMTPCAEIGQQFARTIETVMPLDYSDLKPEWKENRQVRYEDYDCFKKQKEQEVIALIETVYPDIRKHIVSVFSSTSLTFRDDFLTPEGAMFGMSESVGSVRTRIQGFYLTGQNIFLHGLCGVAMTAQQTVQALCEDYD
ncbi:MAG: NAD(P)-binding protein, partial [Paludibacteraceae bacterium]|nr:NAD(P)-binding protein [Paludibacteraceae bacterium]